jgi:predicted MFS family arabinose efflux permease
MLSGTGIARATAAGIAGTLGITSIIGRLSVGLLLDRTKGPQVAAISLALPAVSALLLLIDMDGTPKLLLRTTRVRSALFGEAAETALHAALQRVAKKADAAFDAGDLAGSLQALAALKAPVDAFFDHVMVNADDPALKANRLALLNQLHRTMNRVADISRLAA